MCDEQTLIMGNRDDIEQMSGSNGVVLTSALKLIDKYDLYGQVAYPKHHKQSDVPEIYRLAAKTKVLFICIFSILKSIRFFISRFHKFLQSHIKCLWSWALLQTSHIHIDSQQHYKNVHFSKWASITFQLISLLKWVMYFAGCVYQPRFGGAIWSDTYWGTS